MSDATPTCFFSLDYLIRLKQVLKCFLIAEHDSKQDSFIQPGGENY